ncbi:venom peptide isomerase heavy chain-like [Dermacentor silvarum]|uniref:venom peptide isomerase heavy chain-like n=1 Tax=Dermacentor silvarum TaxID=543639 RepID=UPI001898B758|nr:venom peptide isomerase heavy chain-like [Dermacentor silvarum]XP_049521470.1 venom peptide isomerase heavy chain-like [Dermacentor silvarum]
MDPETVVKPLSWFVSRPFKRSAVVVIAGAAVVLLQLSLVRCETDWTEFEPKACRAAVSGGGKGRTPGLCVPLTWCPPLVAAAGRGRRPRSCGFHESSLLVCCPSADVVNPTTSNTGTLSPRQPPADEGPRNEPGCGAVVDDPGVVTNGPNGGVRLTRSTWPWMAAIFKADKFICGGSLLDRNTVLTAAHCFPDLRDDAGMYKVRVGIFEVNETVSSHSANLPVRWIRLHDRYRVDRHYNDIALVKTATKASYGSHIGAVCLPQPDLKLGGQVVVLGWGHTAFGGRYAHRLQEGRVSVISNEECDEIMRRSSSYKVATPDGITEDFVCAVNHTGVDACQGDSGGPLLALGLDFRWNVVGVVSFGIGCGGRFPGAYSRVTTFLDWIARNRD